MFFTPLLQGAAQQQAGGTGLFLRNVSSTVGGVNPNPGKPANTQPTDILVAVFTGSLNVGQTAGAPTGWTAIPSATVTPSSGRIFAWWASGNVASTVFTDPSGGFAGCAVVIYAFAGADTTNPIRAGATSEEYGTTATAPSVSANAGDSVVYTWYDVQASVNFGPPSPGGIVNRVNIFTGSSRTLGSTVENLAATGATPAQTRSANNFTGKRTSVIAIAAAPTTPTITGVHPLKTPWTRQPQGPVEIDWSNPLTRGLIGLWCPPMGRRNLVSGVRLTPGPTVPVIGVSRPGRAFESSGQTITGNRTQYFTTGVTANPSALSMLCVFESFDAPSSSSAFGQPLGRDQYAFNYHHTNAAYRGAFTLHTGATYPVVLFPAMSANTVYTLAGSWDGSNMRAWQNGVFAGQVAASGTLNTSSAAELTILGGHLLSNAAFNGRFYIGGLWNRALSDNEIAKISANPWQLFKPVQRTIAAVISGVTISRPGSDIVVAGWSASSGSDLYAMIDETVADDADYIVSPDVTATPGPATFGSTISLPAGSYDISIRARRTSTAGEVRVLMKDAGGVTVGTSAWQALDPVFTTYLLSVTTTDTATQLSIEVQQ